MSSRIAAASCVFMYFSFLPAAFFGAPPPMKDIVRRKALQSAPRSGRIFASEGALGDLWAVCGVVKSTARACPYGRLGQTTKPARGRTRHACQSAQQSSGYTPRKINGTTRAERWRMPLLQDKHGSTRLNNPSSTVPSRTWSAQQTCPAGSVPTSTLVGLCCPSIQLAAR